MEELIGIALRLSVMYLYALALMRLAGKRSLGQLSALDFVTTLVVGDQFDDVFWGTMPLANGLFGLGVIVFLHTCVAVVVYRNRTLDRLLTGAKPRLMVKNGRFMREEMTRQRLSEDDLRSLMRGQGEETLAETREAYLEPSGLLSVLKKEQDKPVEKSELDRLKELFR